MFSIILREAYRTAALRAQIRSAGGRSVAMPAFKLSTVYDCPEAVSFLNNPQQCQLLLFVSPYAVRALCQIARRHHLRLPTATPCAAPGTASHNELRKAGFSNVTCPEGVGGMQPLCAKLGSRRLAGRKLALVQSNTATPHASLLLAQHHAKPLLLPCYQRKRVSATQWRNRFAEVRTSVNTLIAFDAASLQAASDMAGPDAGVLRKLRIGVNHPAIKAKAAALGYENIICHTNPAKLLKHLANRPINL